MNPKKIGLAVAGLALLFALASAFRKIEELDSEVRVLEFGSERVVRNLGFDIDQLKNMVDSLNHCKGHDDCIGRKGETAAERAVMEESRRIIPRDHRWGFFP